MGQPHAKCCSDSRRDCAPGNSSQFKRAHGIGEFFVRDDAREHTNPSLHFESETLASESSCAIFQVGGARHLQQLALSFGAQSRRGGARPGAGRPKLRAQLRHTPHRARPEHSAYQPVHVTLRAVSRSLRSRYVARTVLRALRDSRRASFRIIHYSVPDNHVHLIVEAESGASLSAGMRGLMVRVARRVNALLFRRGCFWADRWHGQSLRSPRQVRNALVYVLQNRSKHRPGPRPALDPLSSAQWFNGYAQPLPPAFRSLTPQANAPPETWLLKHGWQRHGLVNLREVPQSQQSRHHTAPGAPRIRL